MKGSWVYVAVALAAAAYVGGCLGGQDSNLNSNATYVILSAPDFKALIEGGNVFLLDVYVPKQTQLIGTDATIPYDKIKENAERLPQKSATIAVYCKSGEMAKLAAKDLVDLGYTNVYVLEGGTDAWRAAGYDI
ncbi:Thiosulfate sulfurtransferase GlpE [uncultured archaeon]|nr:Thiosulfate sulfurtransferase GlpE [uncultured archaeon]